MFFVRTLIILALSGLVSVSAYALPVDFSICDGYEPEKKARQCHAKARGLPKNASWDEISFYDAEAHRKQAAIDLGLPETSSWETITATREAEEEKQLEADAAAQEKAHAEAMAIWSDSVRNARARELGLPSSSTWKEINDRASDLTRQEYAIENGLPASTSWENIQKEVVRKEAAFWRAKGIDIYLAAPKPPAKRKKMRR